VELPEVLATSSDLQDEVLADDPLGDLLEDRFVQGRDPCNLEKLFAGVLLKDCGEFGGGGGDQHAGQLLDGAGQLAQLVHCVVLKHRGPHLIHARNSWFEEPDGEGERGRGEPARRLRHQAVLNQTELHDVFG